MHRAIKPLRLEKTSESTESNHSPTQRRRQQPSATPHPRAPHPGAPHPGAPHPRAPPPGGSQHPQTGPQPPQSPSQRFTASICTGVFPDIQPKPALLQLEAVSPPPVAASSEQSPACICTTSTQLQLTRSAQPASVLHHCLIPPSVCYMNANNFWCHGVTEWLRLKEGILKITQCQPPPWAG